jgi:hypothetical protein
MGYSPNPHRADSLFPEGGVNIDRANGHPTYHNICRHEPFKLTVASNPPMQPRSKLRHPSFCEYGKTLKSRVQSTGGNLEQKVLERWLGDEKELRVRSLWEFRKDETVLGESDGHCPFCKLWKGLEG